MATKKDLKEKKIVKTIAKQEKPSIPIVDEVPSTTTIDEYVEPSFFAKDLAKQMNIDSFDFLLMKREMGLEDNSIITVSEMQKIYNEIMSR